MVAFAVLVVTRPAHAGCYSYEPGNDVPCFGSNGCNDFYQEVFCVFGCVSGTCDSRGGSGLCCGKIYYTPVIYPDGGRCDPGGGCGTGRPHTMQQSALHSPHAQELLQHRSPGVVKLTDSISYREPAFAFVIDHCKREYGVLIEEKGTFVKGGM